MLFIFTKNIFHSHVNTSIKCVVVCVLAEVLKSVLYNFFPLIDRTVKVWTGNEMEKGGGEWEWEMTAGQIQTRVPVGIQARISSGLLLAPQCPPSHPI